MNRYHIGLRTVKTALAVALALLVAVLRGSPSPIFAAIGAIVAMSRTLSDAVRACLTQIAGILCGTVIGCLMLTLLPGLFPTFAPLMAGLAVVIVIACCNALRLDFAVSLSCIVVVSICLMTPGGNDHWLYGANRFLDTSIGLVTALAVNILIKPYNNRLKIARMMTHIQQLFPGYLRERVLTGRYPDLGPLREKLLTLNDELTIFEREPALRPLHRAEQRAARRQEAAYLRGCEQLLSKMADELTSLCTMDSSPAPGDALCRRLAALGVTTPDDLAARGAGCSDEDRAVQEFHLRNLLDANDFLTDLTALG